MNAYLAAALIGVSVFGLVIALFFVVRYLVKNHRKKTVYAPSFVRADKGKIKSSEQMRGSGSLKDRPGKEGRGRFYAFGVLIAGIFGALGMRLWSLQILKHEDYIRMSNENMTAEVILPANRGRILDRNGNELVGNRPSVTVSGKRTLAEDTALVHRLSLVLGIPVGIVRRNLLDDTEGVQSDHTIASDVPMSTVAYIREHPTLFEGVNVESLTVRYYPYGSLGAHVLGYTGPVTEEFLDSQTGDEPIPYERGDIIGKDGAEATFERNLQGMHGRRTFKVDAAGNTTEQIEEALPVSGDDVVLTIDAALQRETDKILMDVINKVRAESEFVNCNAGALVCMDIEDGGILAASSYPTFQPSELSGGISTELWEELTSEESGYPLTNRVVSGLYPAASTFKAFTSFAGMQNNMILDDTTHYCSGWWDEYGETWGQRCWIYPAGHGEMDLESAIRVSCDSFFYYVGAAFYEEWRAGEEEEKERRKEDPEYDRPNPYQEYLRTWGYGSLTGVDMPGEAIGRVPDAAWKREAFSDTPEEALWQPGDMTNMVIGQGDLLVTPMQICNSYAAIARKKFIKPHVFHQVVDPEGNVIVAYTPEEVEVQPEFTEEQRARVIEGLKRVVLDDAKFEAIPVPVAGKTGTAEVAGKDEFAFWVGFAPADEPKYCIACVVEQGGSGNAVASNAVVQTLARIYNVDAGDMILSGTVNER